MPSLGDSIFIFVLALMLVGPKNLPKLARQLGKLMAEFRRASNEFRMQMEDELRVEEQKEHQAKVAAMPGPPSTGLPVQSGSYGTAPQPSPEGAAVESSEIPEHTIHQTSAGISSEEPAAEHVPETSANTHA